MKFEKAFVEITSLDVKDVLTASDKPVCQGDMGGCMFL